MNGSIDLTIEDEPTQVYEEYEGYPTTDSETLSSILPLPNNSSTTTSQKNHYKRGRPRESFIWQHFSDDGSVRTLQPDNDVVGNYNEISHYLSSNVRNDIDPFKWWNGNKNNFPILTKLAKKFLCISATSVASERLFSDVGNIITAKRTNLKPERVGKMVFLKRNLKIVQPFS